MQIVPYGHMSWLSERQAEQVARLRASVLWPALVVILTFSILRSHDVLSTTLYIGLFCLVLASLMSSTSAYRRFDQPTMLAIGALDFVAVLAIGSLPGAVVAGALVVVPGVWLGGVFRWRGAVVAGLVGAMALALARILGGSGDLQDLGRISWILIFGVVAAVATASTISVWIGQVDRLEAHQAALAAALSELGEERERAVTVVHTVDAGLGALGADGSYTSLNPRHAQLMELAYPAGHQGRVDQLGEIYAADNHTRIDRDRLPSMRALDGEPFTDTLWMGDQPTTRRAIDVSSRPVHDSDGGFAGAVIAYHDVTTMMRALAVKDDFVASVSHELRTPLTSIIGNLEMAAELDAHDTDQLPRLLAVASRNADRLLHLVSDLLTISQLRQAGMQLVPEAVDLSALIDQSVTDISVQAKDRDVELTTRIQPGLLLVGDRSRLQQVTENLLSNAVKYTPSGGRVWVTLCQKEGDTVLTVTDTGIGVSGTDQAAVFTKFFRGRNATDRNLPGVGLGLAISKEIIEAHGGTIGLASSEDVGTTVLVTLPSGVQLPIN
ncbi:MAG: ATP-binding region, ATPase domain protein [Marmoricola sp.]|nr:ATP-binding region, ATPase domain protein [Marmoricola sp.]